MYTVMILQILLYTYLYLLYYVLNDMMEIKVDKIIVNLLEKRRK